MTARPAHPSEFVFLVAAEESGDRLGAALMRALRERTAGQVRFAGVGGREMAAEGIASLYPIDDLPLIGFSAIPRRLPKILRLMRFTAKAVVARHPHVLVIIDSPGFTRGIARRVRAADPTIPIVEYVSPSVWAWRPGRARVMRAYIDHILALLPFEPAVHQRLGGPPCTYVGHPLIEEVGNLRPNAEETRRRLADPPVLLMLPGSRSGELDRLLAIFGIATAALAKSGTVTLELALAGVPMIAAYKVSAIEYIAVGRGILKRIPSIILTNLLLGENAVPELLQQNCTAENLAAALRPLLRDTPERRRQIEAFARLDSIMEVGSSAPALRAADIVLAEARRAVKTPLTPAKAGI